MKFARLVYGNNSKQMASAQYINLGDYFQTFAIDNIYKTMNIPESEIYTIDRSKLYSYKGEQMILPMQGWFGYIKGIELFPLPQSIIPVFMGYHCITKKNYNKKCIETYTRHEPICCRDETTYQLMKRMGIKAYLTGCLTVTLPERKVEPKEPHVFLVDAPNGIEKYMPENLKRNITYITQEVPLDPHNTSENENRRIENVAKNLLECYEKEATLVVTSRLHCAGPCLGMGIPVILAREYFDDRYAWIDKFLPLYTPDKFSEIDWNVKKVDLSAIKPTLIKMAEKLILNSEDKEETIQKVHNFYMQRSRQKIYVPFKTKAYLKLHEITPRFADFMREVVLKRFTVATARDKSEI